MVKVKATITTEVVRYVDEDMNNNKELKRKFLEKLAIEGFVNNKIDYMVVTQEDPPDPSDIDYEYYESDTSSFMYGKF
jgi:hypothetical protein